MAEERINERPYSVEELEKSLEETIKKVVDKYLEPRLDEVDRKLEVLRGEVIDLKRTDDSRKRELSLLKLRVDDALDPLSALLGIKANEARIEWNRYKQDVRELKRQLAEIKEYKKDTKTLRNMFEEQVKQQEREGITGKYLRDRIERIENDIYHRGGAVTDEIYGIKRQIETFKGDIEKFEGELKWLKEKVREKRLW